jgi:hypothetical protein
MKLSTPNPTREMLPASAPATSYFPSQKYAF